MVFSLRKTSYYLRWSLLGLGLWSAFSFAEHKVDLQISGLKSGKPLENVQMHIAMIDKEEADGSERYQQLVTESIDKALRAYGYYDVKTTFKLLPPKDKRPILLAEIKIGKPVLIENTEVKILGAAKEDPSFVALETKQPKKGTQLNHSAYEDYKTDLETLARSRGYFDHRFDVSRLEVMPSTYQSWWKLVFDSGERYRFGRFHFEYSQIREDYLRNIMQIKEGDPYSTSDLSTLTNHYESSGWFSSVLLQPKLQEKTKVVDVDIFLHPRKKNTLDLGAGYSSDVGPRLQLSWTRPWINSRGHSVKTNLYLSSPKQTIEGIYKMPLLKNPLNYYYEFSLGAENEKDARVDTKTTAATLAVQRFWNHATGWQHSLGVRVRHDSFTQGTFSDKTLLVYPTFSASRTRLRGGFFTTWGDSQRLTLDVGHRGALSDVSFFKVQASTSWIRTVATDHRFLMRAELGVLKTPDIYRLPPSLRFFAGGDRSVRGYGYKKIAPKDSDGKLIGASRLATGTLEYQYQVYPRWWMATFADTGLAANNFRLKELHYGVGAGVRWASPVGAIKLDIATPVRDKNNSKNIQFYIGLGSEL